MAQNKKTQRKFRKNNKSLKIKQKGGGAPPMDHPALDAAVLNSSTPWYGKSVFSPVDDKGVPLVCRWKKEEKYAQCEQDKYEQYKARWDYLNNLIVEENKAKEGKGGYTKFTDEQLRKIIQEKNIINGQMLERVEKGALMEDVAVDDGETPETSVFTEKQYADAKTDREKRMKMRAAQQRLKAPKKKKKKSGEEEEEFLSDAEIAFQQRRDELHNPRKKKMVVDDPERDVPEGMIKVQYTKLGEGFRVINNSIDNYVKVINKRITSLQKEIERLKRRERDMEREQNQLDQDHYENKKNALEKIDQREYKDITRGNGKVFTAEEQRAQDKAVWESPRAGSKQWVNVRERKNLKERLVAALEPFTKSNKTDSSTNIDVGKGRQLKYQILSMNFTDTELYNKNFSAGQNTNEQYIRYEVEWEKLQIQIAGMTDEECGAKVQAGLYTDFKVPGLDEEMFFTKAPGDDNTLRKGGKRKTRRRLKKRHTRKIKRKH
jgi:hypothetical protein